jgi:hypothetical protein
MKTTTSIATSDQVKSLIQIQKSLARGKAGNLAENKAFLDFIQIQKEVTEQFEATWAVVQELMEKHDVKSIKGDWGYVTMSERKNFKGSPAPRFMKKVIDTAKVSAYMKISNGILPKGIEMTTTKYLAKKIKVVA